MIITAARPIELHGSFDLKSYNEFQDKFHKWVHSSKQIVKGLPENKYIVSGITDAFNQTYSLYNKIGIFEGEYGYHEKVFPDRVTYNLKEADVIIISHPFSADGESSHSKIAEADRLGIPIFIDCAFFGICSDINFDFTSYNNIHSVCFSLSKTFGTGWQRVGLLYTIDPYPVKHYSDWQYPLLASAEWHYDLIDQYGPDDMFQKYRFQQEQICDRMGIISSSTVIFGLDYSDRYKDFKRGNVNRLCISKEFEIEPI
jgi:hypothetical protein